ncbi:MAG: GxxExxY protein [Candidatus Acidiferrales bacterium]
MNTDNDKSKEEDRVTGNLYPEQELTGKIIECAFTVHNALGSGFLEKVYVNALAVELRSAGLNCIQEMPLQVKYRGAIVGDYIADAVVEGRVLLELKACTGLDHVHEAQVLNYLRASGMRVGLLMNFGRPKLQFRRFVC